MTNLDPVGMNSSGQINIAKPGDIIDSAYLPTIPTLVSQLTNDSGFITSSALIPYTPTSGLAAVATSGAYSSLSGLPTIPAAQLQSDWNETNNTLLDYIKNKPTNVSAFTNDAGYITSSALSPYATSSSVTTGLAAKQNTITTGTTAQYLRGDLTLATFPTNVSSFTNDSGYLTSASLSGYVPTSRTVNGHALTGNVTVTASDVGAPSGSGNSTGTNTGDQTNITGNAATVTTNANLTGAVTSVGNATTITTNAVTTTTINNSAVTYAKIQNETASTLLGNPTGSAAAPSEITLVNGLAFSGTTLGAPRTTSVLTLSLVGTGATGTQISATKDSTVRCSVSTSTTSTIGGPSTSVIALKICSTNNATEGSWTTVATFESDQTITLAIALQSIQIVKGQLCADVPAGWYCKLVNSGTGTHSEAVLTSQQTIYG